MQRLFTKRGEEEEEREREREREERFNRHCQKPKQTPETSTQEKQCSNSHRLKRNIPSQPTMAMCEYLFLPASRHKSNMADSHLDYLPARTDIPSHTYQDTTNRHEPKITEPTVYLCTGIMQCLLQTKQAYSDMEKQTEHFIVFATRVENCAG